jgi:hypothetical protein
MALHIYIFWDNLPQGRPLRWIGAVPGIRPWGGALRTVAFATLP